jgi:plastocyanin
VPGRALVAVLIAAVVTVAAAAFALGRGVASDSGGSSTAATSTGPAAVPANATGVEIKDFAFNPANVTVKVGTAVTWTNDDSVGHTVTTDNGSLASQELQQGQTYSSTFTTAGTVSYFCAIHRFMTATVVVEP